MDHVGWTLQYTALYYMQLAKVLNLTGASARLASIIGSEATSTWQDINQLKRLYMRRPWTVQQKDLSGVPNENIVQNLLNIALLNAF